jgi:outer membrane immunogenic protein
MQGIPMKKLLLTTALILGFATGGASAMDFNLGVQGGYAWSESDVSIPGYGAPGNFTLDGEGWQLGGFAGMDWDVGPTWSLGWEADANWTDAEGDHLSGGGPPGERYNVIQNWTASIRARAAVDIAPTTELYGTLGVGWAQVETEYTPLAGGTDDATLQGWVAGVGVERSFGSWFGRAEYRYSSYDSEGFVHNGPSTADLTTNSLLFSVGWTM